MSARTVVAVADAPQVMTEGNWKLALVVDDRASDEQLEKLGNVFHTRWQIGLLITAIAIYIGSLIGLSASRPR